AGSIDALENEAQELRFVGGPQSLSLRMAESLGARVVLASPVRRIADAGGRVRVESERTSVTAKRAVVAMMPADVKRIAFEPALPEMRFDLHRRWRGSPAVKINAIYATPFWREKGLSGIGVSDELVAVTFDNSPPDASCGALV